MTRPTSLELALAALNAVKRLASMPLARTYQKASRDVILVTVEVALAEIAEAQHAEQA